MKGMRAAAKFGRWLGLTGIALVLALPSFAQNRRNEQHSVPRPSRQEQRQPRAESPRSQERQQPRSQPEPQRQSQAPRPYQPPAEGHHSGQWLNQHREQPLDQQRRALENDPQFRSLPHDRQQKFEQRLLHFNGLPPDRQEQVLRRMETWEHLTPQQKQQFRSYDSQFKNLPPDRQQAVRNAIQTLRAMPPDARQQEIQAGRFSQFSPQERQVLNEDRKSTRLNSSHANISYAVFCLKKKKPSSRVADRNADTRRLERVMSPAGNNIPRSVDAARTTVATAVVRRPTVGDCDAEPR